MSPRLPEADPPCWNPFLHLRVILILIKIGSDSTLTPLTSRNLTVINKARHLLRLIATASGVLLAPTVVHAQGAALNLYSARHYQTDEALYANFTRQTGIRINRIEAGDEALLERLRAEGRSSPADVLLLVDAARLWKAEQEGLFEPVRSDVLASRIPPSLRASTESGALTWVGISTRARVIVYNRERLGTVDVRSYEDLARPELKGKVCTRSGAHPYMLSLIASVVSHQGEERATAWAKGVVSNFARPPRGGDMDQIRAVASGECVVALTNTYYLVRFLQSDKPPERDAAARIAMVWPDQEGHGTHINVTGGGVLRHARNRDAAQRFLEYLASDEAQVYLAEGNNEWPAVPGVTTRNHALAALGAFKADPLSVAALGRAQPIAARIIDRVGWR